MAYYEITLWVTLEQETAIFELFKHRRWIYSRSDVHNSFQHHSEKQVFENTSLPEVHYFAKETGNIYPGNFGNNVASSYLENINKNEGQNINSDSYLEQTSQPKLLDESRRLCSPEEQWDFLEKEGRNLKLPEMMTMSGTFCEDKQPCKTVRNGERATLLESVEVSSASVSLVDACDQNIANEEHSGVNILEQINASEHLVQKLTKCSNAVGKAALSNLFTSENLDNIKLNTHTKAVANDIPHPDHDKEIGATSVLDSKAAEETVVKDSHEVKNSQRVKQLSVIPDSDLHSIQHDSKERNKRCKEKNVIKGNVAADGERDSLQNSAKNMSVINTAALQEPINNGVVIKSGLKRRNFTSRSKAETNKEKIKAPYRQNKTGGKQPKRSTNKKTTRKCKQNDTKAEKSAANKTVKKKVEVESSKGKRVRNKKVNIYCKDCDHTFKYQRNYDRHLEEGKCRHVCEYCGKVFLCGLTGNYKIHIKYHLKLKNHECDVCGKKYIEYRKLKEHYRVHTGDKPYMCDECGQTFTGFGSLYSHKKNKHTGVRQSFSCPQCPKIFKGYSGLMFHLKYYHDTESEKPYACAKCGKSFKTPDILKRHESVHKETRDFRCDQCDAAFKRIQGLTEHKKRHTKEYTYFCSYCGKGFYTRQSTIVHERVHTGEKPYTCSLCSYTCSLNGNLKKHLKTHEKH